MFRPAGHSVVHQGKASPGLSDASTGKHHFVLFLSFAGPIWAVAPERRHFPSVWGLLSVDSAAGLLRGGISSDQCHCGRPKTVVARHFLASLGGLETLLADEGCTR